MRKITLSLFILFTFYSSICFSQSAKDFYNSGKTKTYSDKFSAAILDFDKAIELDPNYLDAYVSRGFAYLKLKDFTLCLIDFNKAIEIAPDQGYLYDYRGFLYNNIKQYDKSAVDYNKAIELDPKFKDSFVNRGINYLDLNKHDEAIADFNTAMDPQASHSLLQEWQADGNFRKARCATTR